MIGIAEEAQIAALITLATLNPISRDDLEAATGMTGQALNLWRARMNDFTIILPVGFWVTYTQEHQSSGLCHHLSISIDAYGKMPNPVATVTICKAFGLPDMAEALRAIMEKRPLRDVHALIALYTEKLPSGQSAINLVGPVAANARQRSEANCSH
jgi:hypothetical protein